MNDLRTALEQLQRDVAATAAAKAVVDGGSRVTMGSVQASLGLAWVRATETTSESPASQNQDRYRWQVAEPGTPVNHTLQLTLQIVPDPAVNLGGSELQPELPVVPSHSTDEGGVHEADDLYAACVKLFGTPGFDNAARAEVYGDLAASLDTRQLMEAVEKAGAGNEIPDSDPLHLEIRRLRRLLGYSPVGVGPASEILRGLIAGGRSESLLKKLAEGWIFGAN